MGTGRHDPRRFFEWLLSSFRLRSLTGILAIANQSLLSESRQKIGDVLNTAAKHSGAEPTGTPLSAWRKSFVAATTAPSVKARTGRTRSTSQFQRCQAIATIVASVSDAGLLSWLVSQREPRDRWKAEHLQRPHQFCPHQLNTEHWQLNTSPARRNLASEPT